MKNILSFIWEAVSASAVCIIIHEFNDANRYLRDILYNQSYSLYLDHL